jgi:sporulation protein YlmC with PRC-barrel domain
MTGPNEFVIGAAVSCSDRSCGTLRRVVIDPVARALTHLVVGPDHVASLGRLVPVDLVQSTTDGTITLGISGAEFEALGQAEETDFVPGARGTWGYGQEQMLTFPHFGLGLGTMTMGGIGAGMLSMGLDRPGMTGEPQSVTLDKVPLGEVEVRRGDRVHAKDGPIGQVQGLVVDPADNHVTHVLLEEGHLWGKKDVAIPIGSVEKVGGAIDVALTKDEIKDLPAVEIDRDD